MVTVYDTQRPVGYQSHGAAEALRDRVEQALDDPDPGSTRMHVFAIAGVDRNVRDATPGTEGEQVARLHPIQVSADTNPRIRLLVRGPRQLHAEPRHHIFDEPAAVESLTGRFGTPDVRCSDLLACDGHDGIAKHVCGVGQERRLCNVRNDRCLIASGAAAAGPARCGRTKPRTAAASFGAAYSGGGRPSSRSL